MGSRVTLLILRLLQEQKVFDNGQSNEGNGCHEGNEGHEEEANLRQARQASPLLWQDHQEQGWIDCSCFQEDQHWQDCEQEAKCHSQDHLWPLERGSPEGP